VKKAEDAHHEHMEHVKHENGGEKPETAAYPYLNKRDKPFPWGMNSLFFNPEVRQLYFMILLKISPLMPVTRDLRSRKTWRRRMRSRWIGKCKSRCIAKIHLFQLSFVSGPLLLASWSSPRGSQLPSYIPTNTSEVVSSTNTAQLLFNRILCSS
jgi:hypothetical protein